MSSTLLHIRSPSLFVMSESQQLNHTYNTNQTVHQESKQSHSPYSPQQQQTNLNDSNHELNDNRLDISITNTESTIHNEVFQPQTPDKIQLKSTNRSSHHEVSADNFRIRYYMNLNLVKQPHLASYRSSSLPRDTTTTTSTSRYKTEPELPTYLQADYHPKGTRKSIERKQNHIDRDQEDEDENEDDGNNHNEQRLPSSKRPKQTKKKIKRNKMIHVVSRTKSQNNTPPRQFESMLKKHHKKSRLSRLRSRSDGMLSFRVSKRSLSSTDSNQGIEDDDDNDSVSTADTDSNNNINNQHLQSIPIIPGNLTPPRTSAHKYIPHKINTKHYRPSPNSSLIYQSSRTPPGNHYMSNNDHNDEDHHHQQQKQTSSSKLHRQRLQQRKIWSEPVGYPQYHHHSTKSASIAIRRSRPLSINKQKVKPRFDVDFKPSSDDSYQPSSNPLFNGLNTDSLVDDEANFDMD